MCFCFNTAGIAVPRLLCAEPFSCVGAECATSDSVSPQFGCRPATYLSSLVDLDHEN